MRRCCNDVSDAFYEVCGSLAEGKIDLVEGDPSCPTYLRSIFCEPRTAFPVPILSRPLAQPAEVLPHVSSRPAREALKAPVDPPFRTRESEGGKHIAVTLELTMASAEQVLKVYEHILAVRGLIMLM